MVALAGGTDGSRRPFALADLYSARKLRIKLARGIEYRYLTFTVNVHPEPLLLTFNSRRFGAALRGSARSQS
jgi:hypothetical protein